MVQRAYRPGGAGNSLAGEEYNFDPEFLWNYELSYRSLWLDNRLQFKANLFFMDWEDQQAIIGTDINRIVVNAGRSELYGAEADLKWQATEALSVFAAVGLNETEFTDFDEVDPLLTGNEFPLSPKYQVTLGAIARLPGGFFASTDVSFVDGSFSETANSPSPALPNLDNRNEEYTLVNAMVGYEASNWQLNLYARNLFDEDYTLRVSSGDVRSLGEGFATVGAPRVIGLMATVDF